MYWLRIAVVERAAFPVQVIWRCVMYVCYKHSHFCFASFLPPLPLLPSFISEVAMRRISLLTVLIFCLLLPCTGFAQVHSYSVKHAQPGHAPATVASPLSRADFGIHGMIGPFRRRAIAASSNLTYPYARYDTTEVPKIELRTGFLRPLRFTYGDQRPLKVYSFSGLYFQPEFENIISQHPDALYEAERSHLYNGIALGGIVVMDLLLLNDLLNNNGEINLFPIILSGGAALFASSKGKSHLKRGVRIFNNQQTQGDTPTNAVVRDEVARNEPSPQPEIYDDEPEEEDGKNKLEKWYINFGLGYANANLPEFIENRYVNRIANVDGSSHFAMSMDLLGIYWRRGERLLLGGAINAFGDMYFVDENSVIVVGTTLGFSTMYFVQGRIGSGFFVRGDIGISSYGIDEQNVLRGTSQTTYAEKNGTGWLLGGGYGLPISRGTRLLFYANYVSRTVDELTFSDWAITVSGLF